MDETKRIAEDFELQTEMPQSNMWKGCCVVYPAKVGIKKEKVWRKRLLV